MTLKETLNFFTSKKALMNSFAWAFRKSLLLSINLFAISMSFWVLYSFLKIAIKAGILGIVAYMLAHVLPLSMIMRVQSVINCTENDNLLGSRSNISILGMYR
jgi:hypothetical protein